MNIAEVLRQHAEQHPNDVALVDVHYGQSRRMTYAELEQAAGRTAALFRHSGLRQGDTVLLFHRMSAELYIAVAAIFRCGMTAMFVDPSAGRRHIRRCCELLPPQALIAGTKAHLLRLVSPELRKIPTAFSTAGKVPFAIPLQRATAMPYDAEAVPCGGETPALAGFTSGSTGHPKAAIRTHAFLLAQRRAIAESLSLAPRQVEVVTLPIFVLANLASRVTSVIADADLRRPDLVTPERVVVQIQRHSPDRLAAVPAFLERIVDYCIEHSVRLTTLRTVMTGGGPVTLSLLDRLQQVAPHAKITVVYGSTEAEPISTVRLDEMHDTDRTAMARGEGLLAGQPVASLQVRVMQDRWGHPVGPFRHEDFENVCCRPDEPGEIVVAGDHVLSGYLNGFGEDENKFRVNETRWHRTGDAGYLDKSGRLWLLGRCAARINDGQGTLYPLGVEQAALRHPGIGQAALVSHHGNRVLAVTLRDRSEQPDPASVLKALSFARVDSIRILKRIPVDRRHHSKVDYPALRSLLEHSS